MNTGDIRRDVLSERLFHQALQSAGFSVILTDLSDSIVYLNRAAEDLTGFTQRDALQRPLFEVLALRDEKTEQPYTLPTEALFRQGKPCPLPDGLQLLPAGSGCRRYITGSIGPLLDAGGSPSGLIAAFSDITDFKLKEQEIRYHSFYDVLTGLYNRAFFEEELQRLDSERLLPIALIMGDANGLKLVNDAFGHQAGDALLINMGRILQDVCRREDVVARVGGDEFVIILPGVGQKEAKKVLHRIHKRCSAAPADPFRPSIALGYAVKRHKGQNIEMVYRQAEGRMYTVKLNESRTIRSGIIRTIKCTLTERTHETEEHGLRLCASMAAMGRRLGLHSIELRQLELLADLHDIGKIAVPISILEKPKGLLLEEWRQVRKHCEIGYRIAVFSPDLVSIADAILSHHEHWDGQGYPQGLAGENIPLHARILAIADTYDVLTHDRPYHKAVSSERAISEILRCSGSQFDPELVNVFVQVQRERGGEHRRAEGE